MLSFLEKLIPQRSPLRLTYHKCNAVLAALWYRFPSSNLKVIGVTGTSGKTITCGMLHHLLQQGGFKTGMACSAYFQIGDRFVPNKYPHQHLGSWTIQKLLRQMVSEECDFAVLEVSSHSIDQNRIFGINFDAAVLTNIGDSDHVEYHGNFAEYVRAKVDLFRLVNASNRKPGITKMSILNRDDVQYDIFNEVPLDRKWTYSLGKAADFTVQDVQLTQSHIRFTLPLPNHVLQIETPLIGKHNLMNLLAAITAAVTWGVKVPQIPALLQNFGGVPGRMESIYEGQDFGCMVDFSSKDDRVEVLLESLRPIIHGRLIVIWGGDGYQKPLEWESMARVLSRYADELVLTTGDPHDVDPRYIASTIREQINRKEGDRFFEIEDRYEAIRFALYTAQESDLVLVLGRGCDKIQTMKSQRIYFDDREVVREILQFAKKRELL